MSWRIPFLKPSLVARESYLSYLDQIDSTRNYSNYGPLNTRFERRIVDEHFGGKGACVTTCNATLGLMLAIAQTRRPRGRYALMPSFTFAATPLAAMWCGLEPYFVDIRREDWCVDPRELAEALGRLGDEVAVVVPYATFGTVLDLGFYVRIRDEGVPVVVDAAPCFGTLDRGIQFGQGFPGFVVFSFHATKVFGIGEGGLVYSGNTGLVEQIRRAGNFGFSERRESTMLGLNSKLSEYEAAIGLATLDAFPRKVEIRERIYSWYMELFSLAGLAEQGWEFQGITGRVPHQFCPVLAPEHVVNRDIVASLEQKGIQARTYFSPACHRQPVFSGFPAGPLEVTDRISGRILSLPLWEDMELPHVEEVVRSLHKGDPI